MAQWKELGAQVRKGEKSALVVFWKFNDKPEETEEEDEQDLKKRGPLVRGYNVFNADQVDGFTLPELPILPADERIQSADRFFNGLHADIRQGGARAFYSPAGDFIQMPPFEIFKEPTAYYATLAHESIHWVGASQRKPSGPALERELGFFQPAKICSSIPAINSFARWYGCPFASTNCTQGYFPSADRWGRQLPMPLALERMALGVVVSLRRGVMLLVVVARQPPIQLGVKYGPWLPSSFQSAIHFHGERMFHLGKGRDNSVSLRDRDPAPASFP
jgi:hypothetical protein